ncbi:MAG: hypothetical protein ABI647_13055 [Gemmatimonadota bacterium]
MGRLAVGTVLAGALLASRLLAQDTKPEKSTEPARLFRDSTALAIAIKSDFKGLARVRDTNSTKTFPGTLSYTDPKRGPITLPITLATRGHFRLKPGTCSFPPLRVTFEKDSTKQTAFSGQKSLKLITHCNSNPRFEQNLLIEQSIYRVYNLFTEFSHRSRLARVHYEYDGDSTKNVTRYGFFLEPDEGMARRHDAKLIKRMGGRFDDVDSLQLDLVSVFNYMIGNTDWSIYSLHNVRLLQVPEIPWFVPVSYDFDFSGLVGAPYAIPDYRLPIKSVRTRLYMGACRKIEAFIPTLEKFRAKRDTIQGIFGSIAELDPKRKQEVREYLDEFFKTIAKPKDFADELAYSCSRGR